MTMTTRSSLLPHETSVLLLVDFQARLMPAIADHVFVLQRAAFLVAVAQQLQVPMVATEQNPDRLGPNVSPIPNAAHTTVAKKRFSAVSSHLRTALGDARDVVIAGCEAHVCLLQTALDLLTDGFNVWVVEDACGSRHRHDRDAALRRLAAAGATLVTAEMVAFEWLATADNDNFRAVSKLVKEL